MLPENTKRGFITVKLKDGEKKLCFTTNALVEAEETLGQSIPSMFSGGENAVLRNFGFKAIRILLWAGIRGAGSKWSLSAVGSQMESSRLGEYSEAIIKALASAMGTELEDTEGPEELDPTGPEDLHPPG